MAMIRSLHARAEGPHEPQELDLILPSAWKRCIFAKYTRPIDLSVLLLRIASHTALFGAGDCPNTISFFLSRAPEEPTLIYERAWHKWTCLWHIGAECGHSRPPYVPTFPDALPVRHRLLRLVGLPGSPHSPDTLPMGMLDSSPCV